MRMSGQSILSRCVRQRWRTAWIRPRSRASIRRGDAAIGYTVPNLLVDHSMRNPHVPPGFWRGVNVNHNAIYLECFMDELAHSVGQDPLEFRRKLMSKHPKHLAVLNAVAEKIGWGKPAPQGVYRGIAQMMGFGSYVAGAAEISVTDGNKIKVHRIVAATDPGYAVNPAQIERQIAGSFVYGLSALFYGGCTVKDGTIEQTNFDTYNSMRIAEMPKVEFDHHAERRLLGRRRRADDLRRRARGAQRLLRGDRQTHPFGAAEGPEHHVRLTTAAAAIAAAASPSGDSVMKALRVAIGIAAAVAWSQPVLAASDPPPGAASCSGCHPPGQRPASSVSRLYGRDAGEIVTAMPDFATARSPPR